MSGENWQGKIKGHLEFKCKFLVGKNTITHGRVKRLFHGRVKPTNSICEILFPGYSLCIGTRALLLVGTAVSTVASQIV